MTEAESIVDRTAKAVAYGCRDMATGLATFIDSLPMPDDPRDRADKIADATEVYTRSLSYHAAYVWGLCIFSVKDIDDAGKMFRREDVQSELYMSAMRVALSVMQR